MEASGAFEGWAILELMGHRRLAGFLGEQEIAGSKFVRLEIPGGEDGEGAVTQFYSPSSVYCITPTTEEIARQVAARSRPAPVHRWELPAPAVERGDQDRFGRGEEETEPAEFEVLS